MTSTLTITEPETKQKKLTRLKAIRKKCLDCVGYEENRVRKCGIEDCPLYLFRMGKGRGKGSIPKAIYRYCMWCSEMNRDEVKECPVDDCPLWTYRSPTIAKKHHGRKLTLTESRERTERLRKPQKNRGI